MVATEEPEFELLCTADHPAPADRKEEFHHLDAELAGREEREEGVMLRYVCPHCDYWLEVLIPKLGR